jgi:hypothetical protein
MKAFVLFIFLGLTVNPGCSGFPNPELNIYRVYASNMKSSGLSVLMREIRG